jgi:hypothetical protein
MTRARVKALHDEVNSLLTTLDLGTPLDGMLPHADVLCVIRYKAHQDPGEEDTPWSREGEEQRDMEMITKLDPTSLEALKAREECWPVQDPVGPAPQPDHPVPGPVNRAPNRISLHRTGKQPDGNLRGFRLAPGRPAPGPDHPVTGPV